LIDGLHSPLVALCWFAAAIFQAVGADTNAAYTGKASCLNHVAVTVTVKPTQPNQLIVGATVAVERLA
jgi:hypothetical protein